MKAPLRVNFYYGERDDQQHWANDDLNTIIQHLHAEILMILLPVEKFYKIFSFK